LIVADQNDGRELEKLQILTFLNSRPHSLAPVDDLKFKSPTAGRRMQHWLCGRTAKDRLQKFLPERSAEKKEEKLRFKRQSLSNPKVDTCSSRVSFSPGSK
jgi:hypothetical protein